jgi:hypothetical protein
MESPHGRFSAAWLRKGLPVHNPTESSTKSLHLTLHFLEEKMSEDATIFSLRRFLTRFISTVSEKVPHQENVFLFIQSRL